MIKPAIQNGYKCVVINFRGCSGVKLTSPKIYWMNTWTDIKEPIEYLYSNFCSGEDPTYLKRNIYAYSVSLGAGMLA
jgi:predicted alpha/beta-fold hydrolase